MVHGYWVPVVWLVAFLAGYLTCEMAQARRMRKWREAKIRGEGDFNASVSRIKRALLDAHRGHIAAGLRAAEDCALCRLWRVS